MSIWLICRTVAMFGVVFVTIPFIAVLFVVAWGRRLSIVVAPNSRLSQMRLPVLRSYFGRFLAFAGR